MRSRLRDTVLNGGLAYTTAQCEVMFDGRPHPMCGELFVAIHAGSWRGQSGDAGSSDEVYGVLVTVTMRAARVPQDRLGTNLLVGPTGESLAYHLERIRAKLHGDPGPRSSADTSHYPVLATANATLTGAVNGFVEPLLFVDGGRPEDKYAEWFSADPTGSSPPLGIAQTLTFAGARRIQTIESQT